MDAIGHKVASAATPAKQPIRFSGKTPDDAGVSGASDTFENLGQNTGDAAGAKSGGKAAGKSVGLWDALKTLWRDVSHKENRALVRGTILRYGSFALLLIPVVGWAAFPVAFWFGGRMMKKADGKHGPLNSFRNITNAMDNGAPPEKIRDLGKEFIDHLIPGNDTKIAAARDRLKTFMDGKAFGWIQRYMQVRNKTGFVRGLNRFAAGPLRVPVRVLSFGIQALMMLFSGGTARKAAAMAARKI